MSHIKPNYDAIVIGSGASGAVMAYELTKAGLKVLVLEKGKREDPATFEHNELEMYARLYKQGGLQTTVDNDTTIAQGQTLGGSTVINNAIWMRADLDRILPDWSSFGAQIPKDKIIEGYEYLERKLHVTDMDMSVANKSTKVFLDACDRVGVRGEILKNNRKACIGCGWCNYGCKYNRKTSMLITFIPWAEHLGAQFETEVMDVKIMTKNKVASGVSFRIADQTHNASADKIVLCAGAIGSSEILLKSKINPQGNAGKGLHFLGGFFASAEMPTRMNGHEGIGLTCIAHSGDDHVIETWFAPPGVFALTMGGWFRTHHERMLKYPFYMMAGVMVGTKPTGVIKINRKGETKINFKFDNQDMSRLRLGFKKLAMIFFEAGALNVIPSSFKDLIFHNKNELVKVDQLMTRPDDVTLGSAHPQGGNRMSDDPQKGVVNSQFEVHGYTNLFVADSSVFPTNLWANCQASIMSMSKYASEFVQA